ncbi:MAG: proton-conducting transporter membrane subunit [Acidilobaceae archaeon]|nr:proton-conducting transporter membrane subunit [Acidilobaceae archaeon]
MVVEVLLGITLLSSVIVPVLVESRRAVAVLSWLGLISFTGASVYMLFRGGGSFFDGLVVHDVFSSLLLLGASLSSAMILFAAWPESTSWRSYPALQSLLPLSLFGLFFLAGANSAVTIIAAWLLVSVISYVTIALPGDRESRLAAIRYIYVGMIATLALALWLASSVYATGIDRLSPLSGGIEVLALGLAVGAVGFKLGLFPLHWWLPSVYGKADGRVVAFVAAAVKLGFIALLVRALAESFAGSEDAALFLAILSALTMTYGNVAALTTADLQKILAYSSIAQVGYMLAGMAVVVAFPESSLARLALAGIALQAIAYSLSKAPLFSMVAEAGRELGGELKGLLSRDPVSSVSSAALLASLLGIPPLLGFWGKLYIFFPLASYSLPLLILALINSGVSSAYYIRALRDMTSAEPNPRAPLRERYRTILLAGALLTALLGLVAPIIVGLIS